MMEDSKRKRSRLFYQYLFSYLVILLFPLIVVFLFTYYSVFRTLNNTVLENSVNAVENAKEKIELQIGRLTSIEQIAYLGDGFPAFHLREDPLKAKEMISLLQTCIRFNPFIYDLVYYQEGEEYLATSNTSCLVNRFMESLYHFENWNYEDFIHDMKTIDGARFLPAQTVRAYVINGGQDLEIVTYIRTLTGGTKKRQLIFLLEDSFFANTLRVTKEEDTLTFIANGAGEIISQSGGAKMALTAAEAAGHLEKGTNRHSTVTVKGETYLLSQAYSESYGWYYVSMVPSKIIMEKVNMIRLLMIGLFLLCTVCGVAVIMYFMKQNFLPIDRIGRLSKEIMPTGAEKENEIDHVKEVLTYLNAQNKNLQLELTGSAEAARDQLLTRLFSGLETDGRTLKEKAEKCGISLTTDCYRCGIYYFSEGIDEDRTAVEETFNSLLPRNMEVYIRPQPDQKRLLVLAGFQTGAESAAQRYLGGIFKRFLDEGRSDLVLGLGNPCDSAENICISFQEAVRAADYRFLYGSGRMLGYQEISGGKKDCEKPPLVLLELALRQGNTSETDALLDGILTEFRQKCPPLDYARKACYDIISALLKAIEEVNEEYFIGQPLYTDVFEWIKFETMDGLIEIVKLIGRDIAEKLKERQGSGELIDVVVQYAKENCCRCDFSTTAMAEYYHMSLPYLSQYFKAHRGQNLLDYITELRMEKAKELLKGSDKVIKEIAAEVGYYNVNSFCRRFKQMTDQTPGEYRNAVRK